MSRPSHPSRPPAEDVGVLPQPSWLDRVRSLLGTVTLAGWSTVVLGAASWLVGWRLGWHELMYVATVCLTCLLVSCAFVVGRAVLAVEVELRPNRVVVGERAAGRMVVTNASARRLLPLQMELVVGEATAEFDVPTLPAGGSHEELFVLPTERRAVIPVGPATSVRGDPLGLLRRSVPWTEPVPLFVHPRTMSLGHLGAGVLRDLEGQETPDLSPSDLAFHALRPYEPGDDRRFIHWLTTARVGELMVRQFTDTRRAHLAVLLDATSAAYAHEDDFETAAAVAGSLGVRALADEQEVTMTVGGRRISCVTGQAMLDGLAGVELRRGGAALDAQVDELVRTATGVSLAIVVTGARTAVADLRSATLRLPPEVRTIAIRVDPSAPTGFRSIGSTLVLSLAELDELAHLLWAVTAP